MPVVPSVYGEEPQRWETLKSELVHPNKHFPVQRQTVRLPDGTVWDDYFVWDSPQIACVMPVTKDGKVVVVEQYRQGIGEIIFHFPAGHLDADSPEDAARREVLEETGCSGGTLTSLGKISLFATKMKGYAWLYLLEGVDVDPSQMHHDPSELTRVHLMGFEEVEAMIHDGRINSAGAIAAYFRALKYLKA